MGEHRSWVLCKVTLEAMLCGPLVIFKVVLKTCLGTNQEWCALWWNLSWEASLISFSQQTHVITIVSSPFYQRGNWLRELSLALGYKWGKNGSRTWSRPVWSASRASTVLHKLWAGLYPQVRWSKFVHFSWLPKIPETSDSSLCFLWSHRDFWIQLEETSLFVCLHALAHCPHLTATVSWA